MANEIKKCYLLTFNDNWADEHNVPALACFTEREFNKWKKSNVGKVDSKYEEKLAEFEAKEKVYKDYTKKLQDLGLWTKKYDEWSKEHLHLRDNPPPYVNPYNRPKRTKSLLNAWLGNSGDYFGDDYDYEFGEDMIKAGLVEVTVVDESFRKYFNKAGLSGLSLCNIFEEKEDWEDEDE